MISHLHSVCDVLQKVHTNVGRPELQTSTVLFHTLPACVHIGNDRRYDHLVTMLSLSYFVKFVMAWDNKTPETAKTFRLSERLHGTKRNDW